MKHALSAAAAILCLSAAALGDTPASCPVLPADLPGLSLTVGPGEVAMPGGARVKVAAVKLTFDPPEIRQAEANAKAPRNYADWYAPWEPWPKAGKDGKPNVIDLRPTLDEEGTLILGGLFRQVVPESVAVTSADRSKTFKMGEDYKYSYDWGQIANLGGRLGEEFAAGLKVAYRYAVPRLDLIEMDASGKVSVKKGAGAVVCPQLPAPDAGAAALAGVYIAPWRVANNPFLTGLDKYELDGPKAYGITRHEIFVIKPAAPVEPVNKDALAAARKKLAAGGELKIAFVGDSITLGAEAPAWWKDLWTEKNLGYPSRVVMGLRKRFPKATVTPIAAFQGGTQTKFGLEQIEKVVLPAKADLVLICFGGNDAGGAIGKGPNNPPEQFKEDLRAMVKKARGAGAEVLLVTPMQMGPWSRDKIAERMPAYRQAFLDLAKEEKVGCADVYTEWGDLASRGIPPWSQLHNNINHPGKEGHQVFSDVIGRFFE